MHAEQQHDDLAMEFLVAVGSVDVKKLNACQRRRCQDIYSFIQ